MMWAFIEQEMRTDTNRRQNSKNATAQLLLSWFLIFRVFHVTQPAWKAVHIVVVLWSWLARNPTTSMLLRISLEKISFMPSLRFLNTMTIYILQVTYPLDYLYLTLFTVQFSSRFNTWIMPSLYKLNCIKKPFVWGRDWLFGSFDFSMPRCQTIKYGLSGLCGVWHFTIERLVVSPCKTIFDQISGILSRGI